KKMKLFWAMLLILLPIALIFSESSMNNIQSVSIIAAFPVAIVIIMIIVSFIKDAYHYMETGKVLNPEEDK
ncbi:MAG: BCCT family transporter, partial [Clostridiales bacterium]|nr:BCCT family transporter [Clostridiales bacterium]